MVNSIGGGKLYHSIETKYLPVPPIVSHSPDNGYSPFYNPAVYGPIMDYMNSNILKAHNGSSE